MTIGKPMTAIERKIFKERVIREYKKKTAQPQSRFNKFTDYIWSVTPLYMSVGIIASILFIIYRSWSDFHTLILSGIIWIA